MHDLETIRYLNEKYTSKVFDDTVKIISFRESGWFDPNTDLRVWDHLTRAYNQNIDIQLIERWDEAIIPEGYTVVLVDGTGDTSVQDFDHPEKAVYVFGRTSLNLISSLDENDYDVSINIPTPESIPLFGAVAGGMVLEDRFNKS